MGRTDSLPISTEDKGYDQDSADEDECEQGQKKRNLIH